MCKSHSLESSLDSLKTRVRVESRVAGLTAFTLDVWVGGCLCVSGPRFIQFAVRRCYAVHITALSIELKCTSKGTTFELN